MNYEIWVCPFCREQIVGDDVGLDYAVHEHDGVGYVPVPVQLSPDRLPPLEGLLAAQRARDEENHRVAELERARDAAELAAMEVAWRESAPPEQVQAYELTKVRSDRSVATMARVLKDAWTDPGFLREQDASAGVSSALFFGEDEDRRAAEAELRRVQRENVEETLRLFDEQGPAAVPFWKLREARRKLAELT